MDKWLNKIIQGDCLDVMREMPDECVQCCVTSPPYWGLRDYGIKASVWDTPLGLEPTPEPYVQHIVQVFRKVKRVLRKDGTLWLNMGDSYGAQQGKGFNANKKRLPEKDRNIKLNTGLKPKDLCGIPWRVALALQADGWWLRSDIIWHKLNPMPESVTDRPTKAHEYIFLLTKNSRYFYDANAIREPYIEPMNRWGGDELKAVGKSTWDKGTGQTTYRNRNMRPNKKGRNKRSVWTIATQPFPEAHFATFPPKLIEPCILAGCPECGIVFDPFMGAGTTAIVAIQHGRNYIGIEASPEYCQIAEKRVEQATRQGRLF